MVFSNAENKRGGANETTRSPLLGAAHLAGRPRDVFVRAHIVLRKLWPRHRSRKACILWVTNQGRGACKNILRPKSRTRLRILRTKCQLLAKRLWSIGHIQF
jgi:hypothetical protein